LRFGRLEKKVGSLEEKLKPVPSEGVRIDFDSFSDPEKLLFRRIWDIEEKYGFSPPPDVLVADMELLLKAGEIVCMRVTELFMVVLRGFLARGEVEEWFLKLHFYNFLEDLCECVSNVRKWSVQDREEFLRDMNEKGWKDTVYRIPRGFSEYDFGVNEEKKE